MFVLDLSVEKWVGDRDEGTPIENPTWQQIKSAIRDLDGQTRTLVTLGAGDEAYMIVGGEERGNYIVNVTFDNINFYNSCDRSQPETIEQRVIGGQVGKYPAQLFVDLQTALLAAKTFAGSGQLDQSLTWEADESLAMV